MLHIWHILAKFKENPRTVFLLLQSLKKPEMMSMSGFRENTFFSLQKASVWPDVAILVCFTPNFIPNFGKSLSNFLDLLSQRTKLHAYFSANYNLVHAYKRHAYKKKNMYLHCSYFSEKVPLAKNVKIKLKSQK